MTDTDERMIREIARLCSLPESRVERTVTLLQGGATILFITRYRKEATGGLDEVQVGAVRDRLERLNALEARKRTVRSAIEAAGKMTGALSAQLDDCWDGDKLEDLYLPYKPKRRTRAAAAREKGLEPLAGPLMRQDGRKQGPSGWPTVSSGARSPTGNKRLPEPATSWPSGSRKTPGPGKRSARSMPVRRSSRRGLSPAGRTRALSIPTISAAAFRSGGCPRTGCWPCFAESARDF